MSQVLEDVGRENYIYGKKARDKIKERSAKNRADTHVAECTAPFRRYSYYKSHT